VGARTRWRAD